MVNVKPAPVPCSAHRCPFTELYAIQKLSIHTQIQANVIQQKQYRMTKIGGAYNVETIQTT